MEVSLNIDELLEKRTICKQDAKEGVKKGLAIAAVIWSAFTIVLGLIHQILGEAVDWGDLISDSVILYLVTVAVAYGLYLIAIISFYESALDLPDDQKTCKLIFQK